MTLFEWSDTYSVGVRAMDADHRRLFQLLNSLYDAIEAKRGEQVIVGAIEALCAFAKYHFAEEERLMLRAGYGGLTAQRRAHQEFFAGVQAYKDEALSDAAAAFANDYAKGAVAWLKDHIVTSDKGYRQAFVRAGMA